MVLIDGLRQLNKSEQYVITEHARLRLLERKISLDDVICCIKNGEIIEQYADDKPLPSCLVSGIGINKKCIHAVVSHDEEYIYLITAYYPDEQKWINSYKIRRK